MRVAATVLLVIGFGVLRVSSTTGTVGWAWLSVGLSVAAMAVLIVGWRRNRAAALDEVSTAEGVSERAPAVPALAPVTPTDPLSGATDGVLDRNPKLDGSHGESVEDRPAVAAEPSTGAGVDGVGPDPKAPPRPAGMGVVAAGTVGETSGSPAGALEADASGPAGRPGENGEHAGNDQTGEDVGDEAGTNGSPIIGHGARSGVAGWFSPQVLAGQEPTDSGDGTPLPAAAREQAGSRASDATVVFAPVQSDSADRGDSGGGHGVAPSHLPTRERTDDRIASVAAELDAEVLVVDEYPLYHMAGCRSIDGLATIALSARDAVGLEFTPCEVCTPAPEPSGTGSRVAGARHEESPRMLSPAHRE